MSCLNNNNDDDDDNGGGGGDDNKDDKDVITTITSLIIDKNMQFLFNFRALLSLCHKVCVAV